MSAETRNLRLEWWRKDLADEASAAEEAAKKEQAIAEEVRECRVCVYVYVLCNRARDPAGRALQRLHSARLAVCAYIVSAGSCEGAWCVSLLLMPRIVITMLHWCALCTSGPTAERGEGGGGASCADRRRGAEGGSGQNDTGQAGGRP